MHTRCFNTRTVAAALVVCALPALASAQAPVAAANEGQAAQGPMTVETAHDGFVVAPEYKVTRFQGKTSSLVGAHAGWMIDNTLLIGAAAYMLTDRSSSRQLQYGGAIVEWLHNADQPIGFSLRGLVGVGTARLNDTFTVNYGLGPDGRPMGISMPLPGRNGTLQPVTPQTVRYLFDEHFFVAEPEANLLFNFSPRVRLTVGAGYRAVGGARGYDGQIRGATGSVALQIGSR